MGERKTSGLGKGSGQSFATSKSFSTEAPESSAPHRLPTARTSAIALARPLRRQGTEFEALAWSYLRGKKIYGLKFRRQTALLSYVVDFYCHEHRLCLELDGAPHGTESGKQRDLRRDEHLREHGYEVLRVWNGELKDESVLRKRLRGFLNRRGIVPEE